MNQSKKDPINIEFRSFIESAYLAIPRDPQEKIMDGMLSLLEMAGERRLSLNEVLDHTCRVIFRLFGFREIAIGLKSRDDSLYRYQELFGYRKDVADNFRSAKYTYEDMVSQDRYPHIRMGKLAELNPVEGLQEGEKAMFNRPFQLTEGRKNFDEFHEGDYIDVWIHGDNRDLVGWIELSSPADGKIPSRNSVRWIEIIAAALGHIISEKWLEEDSRKTPR